MSDRRPEDAGVSGGQDDNLFRTDAFLDDLANGVDPSRGDDGLAGLLLGLKADVDAPMPPAPSLTGPGLSVTAPATTQFTPVSAPVVEEIPAAGRGGQVVGLADRRRLVPGFVHGMIGAAAATLVIAGGGTAVYNAGPDSALWGAHTAMFGEHASVVELASTLEEADNRNANGDVAGALELLEQAKLMAKELNARKATRVDADRHPPAPRTVTVTVTPAPPAPPEPDTVTVTSTVEVPPPTPSSTLPPTTPGSPTGIPSETAPTTSPLPVPDGSGDPTAPGEDDGVDDGGTADNVSAPVGTGTTGSPTTSAETVPDR
ncbi:hypothetical protein [Corynebacterium pygosceleis]|uniref:Anti-sigma-D factor RsdA sigma factor binding region domain-containing protein n=1 Tax=Corynebacterium pygosceleis TaxID=2800406 RepID=A0A9Q4GKC9_9CORY|nr:hypothetical protein [Corynebacterium pygosceleis]MCK7637589.1 hypothetical protein [Corynebacterium pygosceleis]MCK7674780.1 hypothetical protein [Corynebacterium pygosceleis]MCL0119631.1 hypothetical protein [Corynebacterium pygosceleis]MCX7468082.1 hypothetical protein [Corynebacterium pygosceleis]